MTTTWSLRAPRLASPQPSMRFTAAWSQALPGVAWNGNGVLSSAAQTNPNTTLSLVDNAVLGFSTFGGEPVDANSLLLKYTYFGDIDQNGQVDADDLTVFANNFGRMSGATQVDGDIDFNGTVDADDLTVFANNFLRGVGAPLAASSPLPLTLPSPGGRGSLMTRWSICLLMRLRITQPHRVARAWPTRDLQRHGARAMPCRATHRGIAASTAAVIFFAQRRTSAPSSVPKSVAGVDSLTVTDLRDELDRSPERPRRHTRTPSSVPSSQVRESNVRKEDLVCPGGGG